MALSGKCWIWVLLIVSSSVCQSSRTSRSGYDINDLPPVYYPGTSIGGVNKGIYEECSASDDDPDGDCIVGTAGRDYPVYSSIHSTGFSCRDFPSPGYYADVRTGCQVFHICSAGGRKHSNLCPNGTIFNQEVLVCDWWYNVDCSSSDYFFGVNDVVHEASKEATRNYNNYPYKTHEYGNNYRPESFKNVPNYGPSKTPDFSYQAYENNNYDHAHGPSRTPEYTPVHGLTKNPDFSHQNYDSINYNNDNNNYNNANNNYNNDNNNYNNDNNNYNNDNNNYNNNNYASTYSPPRTLDYVTVHSPSGTSGYDHQLHNSQHFRNALSSPQVYDTPREYGTEVKTVPKYIIKNVGIGEESIPQYASTPVYKEPYYETPEVQQYDSASYASTVKPTYKKKTTRSNDKSKASKSTKSKKLST